MCPGLSEVAQKSIHITLPFELSVDPEHMTLLRKGRQPALCSLATPLGPVKTHNLTQEQFPRARTGHTVFFQLCKSIKPIDR